MTFSITIRCPDPDCLGSVCGTAESVNGSIYKRNTVQYHDISMPTENEIAFRSWRNAVVTEAPTEQAFPFMNNLSCFGSTTPVHPARWGDGVPRQVLVL